MLFSAFFLFSISHYLIQVVAASNTAFVGRNQKLIMPKQSNQVQSQVQSQVPSASGPLSRRNAIRRSVQNAVTPTFGNLAQRPVIVQAPQHQPQRAIIQDTRVNSNQLASGLPQTSNPLPRRNAIRRSAVTPNSPGSILQSNQQGFSRIGVGAANQLQSEGRLFRSITV